MLVERKRQGECIGAQRRNSRHLEEYRSPGLAVPRAEALGDVPGCIEAGKLALSQLGEQSLWAAYTQGLVARKADGGAQCRDGLLGLILSIHVRRVARTTRVHAEQFVDKSDDERHRNQ
jgi:hypothetical protein